MPRPLDRERNRGASQDLFLDSLASQVWIAAKTIDPDDRQENVVPYPCPLLGCQDVSRRGGEQLRGGFLIEDGNAGDVDDRVDAGERFVETLARRYIHAARAREHDRVVPRPRQRLYCMAAGDARAADDCYAHFPTPHDEHQRQLREIISIRGCAALGQRGRGGSFRDWYPTRRGTSGADRADDTDGTRCIRMHLDCRELP